MSATSLTWGGRSIPGPGGLPAVAVSLTGPSLAQARTQARSAIDAGADVLELRVDLLEEAGTLAAPDPLDAATGAAQVLECLRELGEAIAADGADAVAGAPERRPAAIDVEVQRGCLPQVCAQAHELGIDVVASFHDFEVTPADEVLEEVLARMARGGADLAKIAVWPTSADDVARLLGVCARATAGAGERSGLGVPVAAMSMGALGAVSRVAPAFGTALTFAVVPDEQGQARASAPGQLPIQDVRRCLELLRV